MVFQTVEIFFNKKHAFVNAITHLNFSNYSALWTRSQLHSCVRCEVCSNSITSLNMLLPFPYLSLLFQSLQSRHLIIPVISSIFSTSTALCSNNISILSSMIDYPCWNIDTYISYPIIQKCLQLPLANCLSQDAVESDFHTLFILYTPLLCQSFWCNYQNTLLKIKTFRRILLFIIEQCEIVGYGNVFQTTLYSILTGSTLYGYGIINNNNCLSTISWSSIVMDLNSFIYPV